MKVRDQRPNGDHDPVEFAGCGEGGGRQKMIAVILVMLVIL